MSTAGLMLPSLLVRWRMLPWSWSPPMGSKIARLFLVAWCPWTCLLCASSSYMYDMREGEGHGTGNEGDRVTLYQMMVCLVGLP